MYGAFTDILIDKRANDTAVDFFRAKIRARVTDPDVADSCSRTATPSAESGSVVEDGFYETFNRDNVMLIDVGEEPIGGSLPLASSSARRSIRSTSSSSPAASTR